MKGKGIGQVTFPVSLREPHIKNILPKGPVSLFPQVPVVGRGIGEQPPGFPGYLQDPVIFFYEQIQGLGLGFLKNGKWEGLTGLVPVKPLGQLQPDKGKSLNGGGTGPDMLNFPV